MAQLASGAIGPGIPTPALHGPDGGKMFGVLVVATPEGHLGYLKSFSGQLLRAWDVEGWVPPVFDRELRARVEPPGEAAVKALTARLDAARAGPEWSALTMALSALEARQTEERVALRAEHDAHRAQRHIERRNLEAAGLPRSHAAFHALDQRSRTDDAELRREKARWREEREALESQRKRLKRRWGALERLRRLVSREVSWQLYDTYQFENAAGRHLSLRTLFEPAVPSSGTGDCAAPKLLVYALRHRLVPLALAEFWWGAPPPGGGRVEGAYYPACKDKCGPLLPFLLDGLAVAPARRYRPPDLRHHELPVIFEDERLVVMLKPAGLLSVPGTDASVTDSVLERLRARYPTASGPLLVHRLDVETSGLLVAAKDADAHAALQRQFLLRTVRKRYEALLDGEVAAGQGVIELPLRVDLEQRPRQVVDFVHGKPALTRFEVLGFSGGRTRVAFFPETGRTHQLRVHASHPLGLGAPIVGDRLYGRPERRLMLHAQALALAHPASGVRLSFEAPTPF
jgi:tRNA pseudouridine32 synthase/23S rRNA pseudouridine746 synthase